MYDLKCNGMLQPSCNGYNAEMANNEPEQAIKPYEVSTYVASLDDDQTETKRWRHAGGSKYPSIHKNLPYTDSKAGVVVSRLVTEPKVCSCLFGYECDECPAV